MVCGVINTPSKDGSVTIEDLNPGRGTRDNYGVIRDPDSGPRFGSLETPRATSELKFGSTKLEARKNASIRGTAGGIVY